MFDGVILTEATNSVRIRPLGAYAIAHSLREEGYNILVIDMYSQMDRQDLYSIFDKVIGPNTRFLGYSGTFFSYPMQANGEPDPREDLFPGGQEFFEAVNAHVRTRNPDIKVIFGGSTANHVTNKVRKQERSLGLDYIFYGYSDYMIKDFMRRVIEGRVQQVSERHHGVGVISYDIKGDMLPYRQNYHRWNASDCIMPGEPLPLELARGCVFKCKFCTYPLLGKNKNDDSYTRTEESILAEIQDNYDRYGTLTYSLVDDTVNERTDKLELLLRVRDRSKLDLNFGGFIRLDMVRRKPEQLPLLVDLNFRAMFMGIESMHYPSARAIGKGLPTEEIKQGLYEVHEAFGGNTAISAGFIVGLPHETEETFRSWADWVIGDDCPINYPVFSVLYLTSTSHTESELLAHPERYGYRFKGGVKNAKWENDIWTWDDCLKLQLEYNHKVIQNNRARVGGFMAMGLTKLGYDFNDLGKKTFRDVFDNEFQGKVNNFRMAYHAKLMHYVNNLTAEQQSINTLEIA